MWSSLRQLRSHDGSSVTSQPGRSAHVSAGNDMRREEESSQCVEKV